jgi:hypothetical protein
MDISQYFGNYPFFCAEIVTPGFHDKINSREIYKKVFMGSKTKQQLHIISEIAQFLLILEENNIEWRLKGSAKIYVVPNEMDVEFYFCEDIFYIFISKTELCASLYSFDIEQFISLLQ